MATETKKQRYAKLVTSLKNERSSFEPDWREIGSFIKPRRIRLSRSETNRGGRRNQNIIDSTATQASTVLRAGMTTGMTSSARPWFKFGTSDPALAKFGPVKNWLEDTRSIIASSLLKSNFYNCAPILYGDGGDFGTGAVGMFEDEKSVFRFTNFPLGEYYVANDHRGLVRVFIREFQLTVRQLVMQFGTMGPKGVADWSNFSTTIKTAWERGDYEQWVDVCHVVQPNLEYNPNRLDAKYKPFTDCYFEVGREDGNDVFLREKGFDEFPIMTARWEVAAGDVYGTDCPGLKVLGDVKQLQLGEKVSASAIDKMVRPPIVAPTGARNAKLSQLPGEISYIDETQHATIRPLIDTSGFRVDLLEGKQQQIRDRVDEVYFKDLFRIMSNIDNPKDVTATFVNELKEEKLLMLGPVFGQYDQDFMKPLIDRAFQMHYRAGELPEAPPELQGQDLEVEYISSMAIALKAIGRGGMDVFTGYTLSLGAVIPEALDKFNADAAMDTYADMTGVPPNVVNSDEQVAQIRKQRADMQRGQMAIPAIAEGANAAKTLSETPLNGNTALAALMGAGGGQ